MKKTMLTYRTLDRFETLVDISTLTAEQIEKIEFDAYCANMGCTGETVASRNWFSSWLVISSMSFLLLSGDLPLRAGVGPLCAVRPR